VTETQVLQNVLRDERRLLLDLMLGDPTLFIRLDEAGGV